FTYIPHGLRQSDLVDLENVNLASRVPGVIVQGADSGFGGPPAFAADDSLGTSWRANLFSGAYMEVIFPVPVTVTEIQIFGTREPFLVANRMRPRAGIVQLFDANGVETFTTGQIDLPAPSGDTSIRVPSMTGVRRAKVTITESEREDRIFEISLGEFKVIGSALIRRPQTIVPNLNRLLPTRVNASSTFSFNSPESAIDETRSNWYAESGSPG